MKKYRSILYCIIVLLFFSCHPSSEYPEKMLRAKQCMDAYPDSALAMLDSLQSTILQEPEGTQMYYHLLAIRTRYKCYLPCTSDSLIIIVADYYRTADNWERLMEALQLSEGSKQYHKLALIYSQQQKNTYYLRWDLLYQHTNRPDSAKYYFQKSIASKGSIYTTADAYLHLAELEAAAGNHREAYRLIRTHRQWQDSIRKITNTETAQRMNSLYNYQRTEAENQKLKEDNMQKTLWLYRSEIAMIALIAIGTGYVVYRKQKKTSDR